MINIADLSFRYGESFSLNIQKFNLKKGESVALTGVSGSGKSTFLKLLSGELFARGMIEVLGVRFDQMKEADRRAFRLRHLGMIFQDSALLDYLSLFDNINLTAKLTGRKIVIDEMTEICGIEKLLKRYPQELSEGEKQRAALCRALVTEPRLVLADEPTSSLDPKRSEEITDFLISYCQKNETSLLMVTHDHSLLGKFDRHIDMSELLGSHYV
jgi:putative ABC transport system ATP-binding protein